MALDTVYARTRSGALASVGQGVPISGGFRQLLRLIDGRKPAGDVLKGMEHLRELGPKYGAVLGATTVVTAKNAPRLPSIASMLIDQGIRALRFKHCFEGGEGADADLVARYTALMAPVREAVKLVRSRGATVSVTHFPLCLLGEEAVFATDFTDENVLSIDRDGSVLLDGRASTRRREGTSRCEKCQLAEACTQLDRRYIDAYERITIGTGSGSHGSSGMRRPWSHV